MHWLKMLLRTHFSRTLGVKDGSAIPIKPPPEAENTFLCGKGYHALSIQGTVELTRGWLLRESAYT